jgi:hypothetical protein
VPRNEGALRQVIDEARGIQACAALLAAESNVDLQEGAAQLLAVLCATRADAKQQAVEAGEYTRGLAEGGGGGRGGGGEGVGGAGTS